MEMLSISKLIVHCNEVGNSKFSQNTKVGPKILGINFEEHYIGTKSLTDLGPGAIKDKAYPGISEQNLADKDVAILLTSQAQQQRKEYTKLTYKILGIYDSYHERGSIGNVYAAVVHVGQKKVNVVFKIVPQIYEGLKVFSMERHINAKLGYFVSIRAEFEQKDPIEYAYEHHISLCLSTFIPNIKYTTPPSFEEVEKSAIKLSKIPNFRERRRHQIINGFCFTRMPGETLLKVAENSKYSEIAPTARVKIFTDLCIALDTLDRAGIVHNDVKGDNVFVSIKNEKIVEAYIIDYGVSIDVDNPTIFKFIESCANNYPPEVYGYFITESESGRLKLDKKCEKGIYAREHAHEFFDREIGPKQNSYSLGMLVLDIFFGEKGKNYYAQHIWLSDRDFNEGIKQGVIPNEYENDKYVWNKINFYLNLAKIRDCNRACGNVYSEEECDSIIEISQKLIHPDLKKRITCADATPMLDQLMEKIQKRLNYTINLKETKSGIQDGKGIGNLDAKQIGDVEKYQNFVQSCFNITEIDKLDWGTKSSKYLSISKYKAVVLIEEVKTEVMIFDTEDIEVWGGEYSGQMLFREIFMNTILCQKIFINAFLENKDPVAYSNEHHISLCFSAIFPNPNPEKTDLPKEEKFPNISEKNKWDASALKKYVEEKVKEIKSKAIMDLSNGLRDKLCFSFVPGQALCHLLQDNISTISNYCWGTLAPLTRAKIFKDLCIAITTLDDAGIVHNSIGYESILVNIKNRNEADAYIIDLSQATETFRPDRLSSFFPYHSNQCYYSFWIPPEIEGGFTIKTTAKNETWITEEHICDIWGKDNGAKYNSFQVGMMLLPIFFGKVGYEINEGYLPNWRGNEFEKYKEGGPIEPFWDEHPYLWLMLHLHFFMEEKIRNCNKACGNIYTEEECDALAEIWRNLIGIKVIGEVESIEEISFTERKTCKEIIPIIDSFMKNIEIRQNAQEKVLENFTFSPAKILDFA